MTEVHGEHKLIKVRSQRLLEIRDWAKQNGVEFKTELRPLRSSLLDLTRKSETDERGEILDPINRQRMIWAMDIICGLEQKFDLYDYAPEFELWQLGPKYDQLQIRYLPRVASRNKRRAHEIGPYRIDLSIILR